MPTLKSLNVHPQLCQKLVADATPPITTPLALLSRDAATTAQQLDVPLSLWNEVRLGVANAILLLQHQQQQQNDDDDDDDDGAMGNNNAMDDSIQPPPSNDEEEDRLIVGSISSLEYWKQQLQSSFPKCSSPISPWLDDTNGSAIFCQLTGPPATGKTQLCLDLAVQYVTKGKEKVLCYYLTSTTPPVALVRRLRQLVVMKENNNNSPKKVLEKIEIVSLSSSSPHQLLSILQTFRKTKNQSQLLIVVDSISGCLGTTSSDWNLIQQVSLSLKQLVHLYGVHVICTNGVSSSGGPALGQVWNQVAEIQIQTEKAPKDNGEMMRATLTSHPEIILQQQCDNVLSSTNFCITSRGIRGIVTQKGR